MKKATKSTISLINSIIGIRQFIQPDLVWNNGGVWFGDVASIELSPDGREWIDNATGKRGGFVDFFAHITSSTIDEAVGEIISEMEKLSPDELATLSPKNKHICMNYDPYCDFEMLPDAVRHMLSEYSPELGVDGNLGTLIWAVFFRIRDGLQLVKRDGSKVEEWLNLPFSTALFEAEYANNETLDDLSNAYSEHTDSPASVFVTEQAQSVMDAYSKRVFERCNNGEFSTFGKSWASRWPNDAWVIALVFHVIKNGVRSHLVELGEMTAEDAVNLSCRIAQSQTKMLLPLNMEHNSENPHPAEVQRSASRVMSGHGLRSSR